MNQKHITIRVNGDCHTIQAGTTIKQLLAQLEMNSRAIAVEVNQQLQPRNTHDRHVLNDNDSLEIVTLVGGG